MAVKVLTVGPLAENCIIYSKNNKCIIFDPGDEGEKIANYIKENALDPLYILNTHGHFDHVGAVKYLQETFNNPFYIHRDDSYLLKGSFESFLFGMIRIEVPANINFLNDNEFFQLEDEEFLVIHTPGHTKGSVCFYNSTSNILISGDTLFYMSIGRTDLPGGDYNSLITSVKKRLFTLPDNTKVYPGHNGETTLGFEKMHNPFLQ
jgi:glyoxylase-like metal-dependent hydrolase (beta-lactamase superfamily II)